MYVHNVTAVCLYCGRVGAGLSVMWELYRSVTLVLCPWPTEIMGFVHLCSKVASRWKYIKTHILKMHGPLNVKFEDEVTYG